MKRLLAVGAVLSGLLLPLGLLLAPLAVFAGVLSTPLTPSAAALADIPAELLAIYRAAAASSTCQLPWTALAGVGKVETDHSRFGGPTVTSPAGAQGPMQFLPGTWAEYGVDGDGDGDTDVFSAPDAIPATAGYLCALGAADNLRRALASYNAGPGNWQAGLGYADEVLQFAARYTAAATAAPMGQPAGPGAWGGHSNGRIPPDALCPINPAGTHLLRCDAAAAFGQLDAAYQARFGTPISITSSYRSYDDQVGLKQSWCDRGRCEMAATPGNSNHGWGLALDLGGGINDFGTPQHDWLQAHGPAYGWHHPPWARQGRGKEEPWHWEYGSADPAGGTP